MAFIKLADGQEPTTVKVGEPAAATVDLPATVKPEETIAAKKAVQVKIGYKKTEGHPGTGKLIVGCAETPSTWVYYLKSSK